MAGLATLLPMANGGNAAIGLPAAIITKLPQIHDTPLTAAGPTGRQAAISFNLRLGIRLRHSVAALGRLALLTMAPAEPWLL